MRTLFESPCAALHGIGLYGMGSDAGVMLAINIERHDLFLQLMCKFLRALNVSRSAIHKRSIFTKTLRPNKPIDKPINKQKSDFCQPDVTRKFDDDSHLNDISQP